jgi:hypothetical protein
MEDAEKYAYPAEETAAKHGRIVKEASRLFREQRIDGIQKPFLDIVRGFVRIHRMCVISHLYN